MESVLNVYVWLSVLGVISAINISILFLCNRYGHWSTAKATWKSIILTALLSFIPVMNLVVFAIVVDFIIKSFPNAFDFLTNTPFVKE